MVQHQSGGSAACRRVRSIPQGAEARPPSSGLREWWRIVCRSIHHYCWAEVWIAQLFIQNGRALNKCRKIGKSWDDILADCIHTDQALARCLHVSKEGETPLFWSPVTNGHLNGLPQPLSTDTGNQYYSQLDPERYFVQLQFREN